MITCPDDTVMPLKKKYYKALMMFKNVQVFTQDSQSVETSNIKQHKRERESLDGNEAN